MAPSPAPNSFIEITRSLRLYVPQLPITLAEQFIRDRYRRILERKDWGALRAEGEFQLNAQRNDGTVTVTRGSPTVTGSGTSFASTDIGRQFKGGTGSPVYTIANVVGQTLTLDRNIGIASQAGLTYTVFDGYVTPPSDFLRFMVVSDPLQAWRLRHWVTQDELMAWDPQRIFFGQPYAIVDRMFNTTTATPQFEAWPYTTAARTLYFIYIKRGSDLVQDTDTPIWPIRSDALVKGALADVAKWPGTRDDPNPYFANPAYWKSYEMEFEDIMVDLERKDEEIYMTYLSSRPWAQFPFAPMSAAYIQQHAI